MAESRSEVIVGRAFGGIVLRDDHRPGPASYDEGGQRFVFVPKAGESMENYAIDVEAIGTPEPDNLRDFFEKSGETRPFFRIWTELEVIAKITDQPCHILLRAWRPANPASTGVELVYCDSASHWITVGRAIPSNGLVRSGPEV